MYSPIEQLIIMGRGQAAVLVTPFVGSSDDYDPTSPGDFAPSEPQRADVVGIWSDDYEQGFQEAEIATFLVPARCLPDQAAAMRSTLELFGEKYRIVRIRRRVYMGGTDGFNLFLAA